MNSRSVINIFSGGLGYLIPMVLNVISTPIIINTLGSSSYGLLSLVNVIIGYLMVSDMGLDIPIVKNIAEIKAKNNIDELQIFIGTTIKIYFRIGFVGFIIVAASANLLANFVFKIPVEFLTQAKYVFFLAGIGFFFSMFNLLGKAIFNGLQLYEISNGVSVFQTFISISVGIVFIKLGYGIVTFVLVRIVSFIIGVFIYYFLLQKSIKISLIHIVVNQLVWIKLKTQIGYGFILRITSLLVSRLDQTLLGIWIGLTAIGLYAIPLLIATSLSSLIGSICHFILPKSAELYSENSSNEKILLFYIRNSKMAAILAFVLFVPIIALSKSILILWINPFIDETAIIALILLSTAYLSNTVTNTVFNSVLIGSGRLNKFIIYTTIRGVFMFLFCIFLIKHYGILGASTAMLLTCIIDYAFVYYSMRTYLKLSLNKVFSKSILKPLLIGIFNLLLLHYLQIHMKISWLNLIIQSVFSFFIFCVAGFIIRLFNRDEISEFKNYVLPFFINKIKKYKKL